MTNLYHVITPGDHFSPRTGSAIPTVVHGLATGATTAGDAGRYVPQILLQRDTFTPRYDSAASVEYTGVPAPSRIRRYLDGALGRIGLPRQGTMDYWRPVADRLREAPAGIVLAHNAPVLPWLLRDSQHQVLLYAHNDLLRTYSRAEAGRMLAPAARLICVSQSLAAQHEAHLPSELLDRIRVVRNGVDTHQFVPASGREPGPLRVMFLGRVTPEKGADILLTAAGLLDRTDLQYLVVGSHGFDRLAELSPFEQKLRELAAGVRAEVVFEPFVDRPSLPALLQRADLLVVPSRWPEPSTLTVGEGMAAGLPIVAARMGGIPEVLGDAGALFDPADPAELAAIIQSLADDPGGRAALATAARQRAEQHDWTWSWHQLVNVLDELAEPAS